MSTYTRSELENSGQCHQKSIGALPLSSMPRVEPGLILIIGVASCAYTIREISFREIHLMMNSRNIQPAKILRCTVLSTVCIAKSSAPIIAVTCTSTVPRCTILRHPSSVQRPKMSSPKEIIYHLSFSAPPYFVDQYEKCLAKVSIRIRSNPSQPSSTKFWDLYTAHASLKSPEEAAKYVYTIFTGLGWEGLANLKVFLKEDKDIDGQVVNTLKHIAGNFEPVLYKLLDKLDGCLGNYQLRRYTIAVTVLAGLYKIRHDKTFLGLFTIVKENLGTHPLAVAFTVSVLERSS